MSSCPSALTRLLQSPDAPSRAESWAEFLEEYSRLILHAAHSFGGSQDAVMDRYAHVLEQLRRDDYRRLDSYTADGRGKFSTWLVVVVRRLCLDQVRSRYGRRRGGSEEAHRQRRELADLVAADVDPDFLPGGGTSPEYAARVSELNGRLNDAIALLEPADRLLLRLRFHDEVPIAEIARVQSFPSVFHVYRRLNAIFDELRQSLNDAGVRDAAP